MVFLRQWVPLYSLPLYSSLFVKLKVWITITIHEYKILKLWWPLIGAHHAVIMFNFGWVAMIETTVLTSVLNGFSLPANPFEWYLIVILAVFSFCGQILLTRSLQLEQAGPVSVVRATTDIALAFLWQIIIFRETPDMWSIFGALLVSSCILLTSLRKWVLSLPDNSRWKDYFRALTF